jgi:hypothetical protein
MSQLPYAKSIRRPIFILCPAIYPWRPETHVHPDLNIATDGLDNELHVGRAPYVRTPVFNDYKMKSKRN